MPVSRRDFLKFGAVAGSLAPLAQSLGVDAGRQSVAIVGAGVHGRRHLSILREKVGGQVVAVADACVNTQQALMKSLTSSGSSGPKIFRNSTELLTEVRPDFLVCAIPAEESVPVIAGALRAGCEVLVDHRSLPTANEWQDLEALAYRLGRRLRMAAPWQTDASLRALFANAKRDGSKEPQRVHLECATPFLAAACGSVREEIADLFPALRACMQLPLPDAPCSVFAAGSAGAAGLRRHSSAPGFVAAVEWDAVAISIRHRLAGGANDAGTEWRISAGIEGSIAVQRADETLLQVRRTDEWRQLLSGVFAPDPNAATRRALKLAEALTQAWQTGRTLRGVVI